MYSIRPLADKTLIFIYRKTAVYCTECDREFTTSSSLNMHKKVIHEGIKPHQCKLCLRSFGQKAHLVRHVENSHKGRRQNKCHICNSVFSERKSLKNHLQNLHSNVQFYTCIHCRRSVPNDIPHENCRRKYETMTVDYTQTGPVLPGQLF